MDGWPLTKAHVELLARFHIIPVCVVELEVSDQDLLRRAEADRSSPSRQVLIRTGSVPRLFMHFSPCMHRLIETSCVTAYV